MASSETSRLARLLRRSSRRAALGVCVGIALLSLVVHVASQDLAKGRSFAHFKEHVAPTLAGTCSAKDEQGKAVCHGRQASGAAAEVAIQGEGASLPHLASSMVAASCASSCHQSLGGIDFSFPLDSAGQLSSDRHILLAFEKAALRAKVGGGKTFARILRMPLAAQAGGFGLYHGGGEVFDTAADSRFTSLADWVAIDNGRRSGETAEISAAEVAFRDDVLPALVRNSCMSPSCHIFNHSSFVPDPGLPSADLTRSIEDHFTAEQVSFNRMTAKGLIQTLVHLGGDVEESRILRKIIPIDKGGLLHRGGNDQFLTGPDDPDYQAIKGWLELERAEAAARLRVAGEPVDPAAVGAVRGVVFVRTRVDNRRRYLDVGRYLPGGDLYLLKLREGETLETATGTPINLTGRFHPGREADVREPDVRHDGRAVVFAMRVGEEDNLNLYELAFDDSLDVVEGSFRRLTWGPREVDGVRVHYTDPTYVPDPLDTRAAAGGVHLERADLVFSSNLAGEVVQSVERGIVGEADGGDRSVLLDLDRPERDGSFVGRRLQVVSGTNAGLWRYIIGFDNELFGPAERSMITVDEPFPEPIDATSVYIIERGPGDQPGFLPSYSVYGMKIAAPGEEDQTYQDTITRVTWTPGQDLDLSVRSTGEVFYASQRSSCDKDGRPVFQMASCRRHLDTRFSFPTHHGNRSEVLIYADNYELPGGIDIHIGLDPDNLWEGGNLSVSDHQFGPGLEARNPNDYATAIFDDSGVPRTLRADITNTRFDFTTRGPAHPRAMFKKIALFPLSGPDAVSRTGLSPGGVFRDTVPLADGGILVAHSPEPIDHLNPFANPDFDLYILRADPSWHPVGGKGTPTVRKHRIAAASAAGQSDLQPYPVAIRPKPKVNAGRRPKREHLIRYPGRPADTRPATYLERNYLLIDAIMRDPSPVGKRASYEHDPVSGEAIGALDKVTAVRFVEALPMTPDLAVPVDLDRVRNGDPESTLISNGMHGLKRVVGETQVRPDGSVYIKVPSNTPMIIQSLNRDGMALRQEARHYFFVPNEPFTVSPSSSETFQTCGACMGSMTGDPKDLFGPVNPFSGQGEVDAIAEARGTAPSMGLEVADRRVVDFGRDVQPLLDRHCVACHGDQEPAAGLALTSARTTYYNEAYESLMELEDPASGWYGRKRYVSERNALAIESYLIEKVFGRELKAPRALEGDAPHPSPALFAERGLDPAPLSDEQRRTLALWIDLGATFHGPVPGVDIALSRADGP